MKRWKVTFGLFLLLFALATTVACAETREEKVDLEGKRVIFAQPGETIHFTYDVPEGFIVDKEGWSWCFAYTDGRGCTYYDGEYGDSYSESYTYEPTGTHVEFDGKGSITLSNNEMVRVELRIQKQNVDYWIYMHAYVIVADPAEYYTYEIQNGEATITGYNKDLLRRKVLIPQEIEGYPVTTIGDRAFSDMPSGIGKEFYIPDNVTTFGKEAFAGSAYLDAVRMPQKLTKMGEGVFAACLQMHFLEIPDSLTEIPDEAFVNCWGYGAGRGDYSVEQCIGKNVTKIGKGAFGGCWNMGRAWGDGRLPEKLESIGEGAFQYCYKIKSLEIPAGVTVIPDRTFQGCERLESIQIDGDITMIGAEAFDGCVALTSMPLSKSLSLIGADAFRDCTALTDFQLAEGNTHFQVQQGALMTADATRLLTYAASAPQQSFVMPETLTQIDDGALKNLRYLETLTFLPTFSDYQAGMFENATGLKNVNFGEGTLTAIPDRFFKGCTSLVSPNAFTGVTSVGESAFEGCTAVQSLSFDDSLSNIGTKAFQNCTALESVHIPDSVTSLSAAAFRNDVSLTEFQMPERLHTVSASAFSGCTSLKTVTWSKYLQTIEANAFENTALTEIIFPESLTRIGAYAFAGIGTLESIVLPENLNTIGSSAFSGTGIQTLKLPKSVTTLGNGAWMNCAALWEVQWDAAVTKIPASTFEHCTALTQIELPDGIVEIGARAFSGNESLTNVTLPRTVRRIESAAFEGCSALTDILLWPDVEEIAADAFANCENLTIRGWKGSAAEKAATSQGVNFAAADQEISYTLNAAQDGYLVSGCDENAVLLVLPAVHNGLPVVGTAENAFANCKYLQEVRVEAESVYLQVCDGILMDATGKTLLLYPARRAGADLVIDENVTAIADYAFAYCQNLRSITIGTQVEMIGNHAFDAVNDALCLVVQDGSPAQLWASAHGVRYASESTSFSYRLEGDKAYITGYTGTLPDVVVPAVIDGYPVYAIENLRSPILTHVVVSEGIEEIGEFAFMHYLNRDEEYYVNNLVSVSLPQSLKVISDWGFSGQENLQEITFGGVEQIGRGAFSGCSKLTQITLPDTLTTIEWKAFEYSGLTSLTIPVNVSFIRDTSFIENCSSLTTLRVAEGNPYYEMEDGILYQTASKSVFYTMPNIEGVITVRDGTERIGNDAFSGRNITGIQLPDTLIEIGEKAFADCKKLTAIELPEELQTIKWYAFGGCTNLEKVTLPEGLTTLGSAAFAHCTSLTEMTIPNGVTELSATFVDCVSLSKLTLPDDLKTMKNGVIEGCNSLETLNLPATLQSISGTWPGHLKTITTAPASVRYMSEDGILYDKQENGILFVNASITGHVTVREGIATIGETAFSGRKGLTSITLPESCISIGDAAFKDCTALSSVEFPDKLESIGKEAFCNTGLQSIEFTQQKLQIASRTFADCEALTNVVLPDGVECIEEETFKNCSALVKVELPESCTSIEKSAFANCTALNDIEFPEKLESIGYHAFRNTGITSLKLSQPGIHVGGFAFAYCHQLKSVEITSTDFDLMEWAFARCENLETVILSPQVFRMEGGCFTECTSLTTVVLPKNITFVHGFKGCTSLKTIEIPDSVTSIGYEAFANCKSLESIHLPDGVTNIGDLAFARCFALKDVNFPAALTTIGKEAFRSVPIAEVVIPANVTEIADMAFYYNEELRSLTLPNGLKKIGESAFWNASKLQTVELPESLTEIGETAFRQSGLTSITIPGDVKRIGTGAFAACENLEKVSVAPGVETIGSEAFTGCTKLTEATLTSSVTTIEGGAFYGCKALQTISGGALIQFIGENAFMNCENLEELNISPNLTEIQGHAFDGCKTLKRVSPSAEQKGVSLPHVKYIGERAFNVCKAIPSFSLGDSLETVGDYAFASTSVTSMYFPDTVKQIGINPMWMNYAILSVHLPKSLTEIPQGMFAQAARIQTLTIPQGVRSIGTQAFHGNVALAALKLPDGLERIGANAFGNAMLLLEIPASVTEIADDAFSEAVVEFYTPSGSAAHQYALAHQIPVHLDESIPAEYLGTADQLAAKIVAQVITDDMTDYQKAEALVDWMLSETKLSDMLPHTYSGKMVLVQRKGTRWGWAFAYKALLNAANVTNGIYFNAKGIIEGVGIGDQSSVFVSYFDGDAVNMIQIDGQWYFTHPAFVEHFGKARYFMLNRETYRLSFGDDPKVEDCDDYNQTFLYQAYSKDIEAEVVEQASASFTEGKKLVYAEVQPIEELMDAHYAYVLDFAGRHMDTLDWQNAQGEFEPTIIGTNNGYWLSDDLTGEYAQVTVNTQTLYPYGAEVRLDDPEYTAMLCDWNVDGTLTLTEGTEEANVALFTIERGEDIEKKQTITGRKVYHATFTPTLSQYINTLAPTEFDLVLECQLPPIRDAAQLEDNKLTLTLSDSHIFPENAQLDLIFWPQDGISSAPITHFYVEDRAELYPDGKREITLDLSALRCDLGYALYIAQTADNYVESEQSYVTSRIDIPHTPYIETVRPATPTEDGLVSATVCRICDTWLGNGYAIASDHILQLPANLKAIEEEAFAGMWQVQQVNIPEGVTAIGKRAFADCSLLRLVIIPNSVQTLADDAFSGCHPVILCDAENQQVIDWANAQGLMVVFKESK